MKTLNVPCRISVRRKDAPAELSRIMNRHHADAVDPVCYKCLRCGLEWECCPVDEYRGRTCSNCYCERVIIITVRLGFQNWGAQNGGKEDQMNRYRNAANVLEAARDMKADMYGENGNGRENR